MNNERLDILDLKVNHISFEKAIVQVKDFAYNHSSSYVCFANSHMTIEAQKSKEFARQINNASLVLTDGMPLAMACFILYRKRQERIAGMDFMPRLLSNINKDTAFRPRVFFYGSTHEVLVAITKTIQKKYQNIIVAGSISPPFRVLEQWELEEYIASINNASPHFVFVGLGCPKQEKWMAENYKKINGVLLGVGGAFTTMAGLQKRAPQWMQKTSLEWFYRLCQEPRRLFKRYFITNSLFILMLSKTFIKKLSNGRV